MFKTVKIGSRLCYGIAYSDNTTADPKVDDFAKKVFTNYQAKYYNGPQGNSGNLQESEYESSKNGISFAESRHLC